MGAWKGSHGSEMSSRGGMERKSWKWNEQQRMHGRGSHGSGMSSRGDMEGEVMEVE